LVRTDPPPAAPAAAAWSPLLLARLLRFLTSAGDDAISPVAGN
jgi:hypothetical protein